MDIDTALDRLRTAADQIRSGWTPPRWHWRRPDGTESEIAGFADLDLAPGTWQEVRAPMNLPSRLHGVDLSGDTLQVRAESIFPIRISLDGEQLVNEGRPALATGPVLIDAGKVHADGNGTLQVEILRPASHGAGPAWANWFSVHITTPRLQERFELLDVAWSRLLLAREVAADAAELAHCERAAALVPEQLAELADHELHAVLSGLAETLAPLAAAASRVPVHVVGHCHIDLAWLWTWEETREVIKRDLRSVVGIMRDYPEATFTHSQPAGYEVVRHDEPELFAEIQRLVQDGRWEPATIQWVEGDTHLAGGEAMASQLLEGVAYTKEHLGVSPRVFLAPDTFGHSANLPQLAASAGAQVYYHHRGNPGGRHGRWPAYWWEGIDGTRLLSVSTVTYNGEFTAQGVAEAAVEAIRAGVSAALLFVGVGDHGGGPTREGLDRLRRIGRAGGLPPAFCSTISAYAEAVRTDQLPVHRGESPPIFEGCYTTHADAKRTNRDGENLLTTAETVAALARLDRPSGLTSAWRDLCFHQFHDILPGSAIHEVYEHTARDHARLAETAGAVVEDALAVLHAGHPAGAIAVTNPLGHDRTDVVTVAGLNTGDARAVTVVGADGTTTPGQVTGEGVTFVARVPAFGTTSYTLSSVDTADSGAAESAAGPQVRPEGGAAGSPRYWRVETPHFTAAIRADSGIITSFVDRRADRELVAFGMQRMSDYIDAARPDLGLNVLQVVEERPHALSAWQYAEVGAEHTLVDGARTELIEAGPVRVVLRVRHTFRASTVVEDITFYRDLPRVDLALQVDWQEPGGPEHGVPNLKLAFAPDLDEVEAWYEVPHGAVRRRSNGQQVPAQRWADLDDEGYGVAVLNDAIYGHDALGARLRLTLLRTAYEPDPRSDQGEYVFRCSLVPHLGDWRQAGIPAAAAGFNQPLLVRLVSRADAPAGGGWRPRVETTGVVTTALRVARDGSGTVIRLVEAAGQRTPVQLRGLPAGASVWRADVTEHRRVLAGTGPEVSLMLRPWQVDTIVVDPPRLCT
ncbi:alpha-mannosidase [Phytoactinopolyspora limicola]|uniref:alpha-mannosidase n=1 Tax=Phytoactinopolyspora limicola TaxID=2715536 RepID=UPI001409CDA9|nr:alpha-mannosidase [Phytoactinopolyspora limicola]